MFDNQIHTGYNLVFEGLGRIEDYLEASALQRL
jgi:hypothetical protein